MRLQWFVNINGIQKRHIETGEPHINDNGYFKVGMKLFKLKV